MNKSNRIAILVAFTLGIGTGFLVQHIMGSEEAPPAPVVKKAPKPEPAPAPVVKKAPTRNPHNMLFKGEECTLELAKKLDPKKAAKLEARIEKANARNVEEQKGTLENAKGILKLAGELTATEELPGFDDGVFSEGTVEIDGARKEKLTAFKRLDHTFATCELLKKDADQDEGTSLEFSGDPRNIAAIIIDQLNTGAIYEPHSYFRDHDFMSSKLLPSGLLAFGEEAAETVIRSIAETIVQSPRLIRTLGPWAMGNMLPKLEKHGIKNARTHLRNLWATTEHDFKAFNQKVMAHEYKLDSALELCEYDNDKCFMYRRWLNAGKGIRGNRIIKIYQIWFAIYATDLKMKEANKWMIQAKSNASELDSSDREFYGTYLEDYETVPEENEPEEKPAETDAGSTE